MYLLRRHVGQACRLFLPHAVKVAFWILMADPVELKSVIRLRGKAYDSESDSAKSDDRFGMIGGSRSELACGVSSVSSRDFEGMRRSCFRCLRRCYPQENASKVLRVPMKKILKPVSANSSDFVCQESYLHIGMATALWNGSRQSFL